MSSTSAKSTEFDSLEDDTLSGSEVFWLGSRSRNQSSSSRGSRLKSFQHQSTGSCDSGVFGDKSFRLLMLGSVGVGKTCLSQRLLHKSLPLRYKPTLQEMYTAELEFGGTQCVLTVEDTGDNFVQEFPAMAQVSLQAADAVLLVFSIDDPKSFEEVS